MTKVTKTNTAVKKYKSNLNNFDEKYEHAKLLVKSSLVPFDTAEDYMLVEQAAKDFGIPIISAISSIYVIKGRVTVGAHIIASLLMKGGILFKVNSFFEPVTHFLTRGSTPLSFTAQELVDNKNIYEVITADKFNNGDYDKNKIPLIKTKPPFIDDGSADAKTVIYFKRKIKMEDGTYEILEGTHTFYLHEAYRAGYMGAKIPKPKETWYLHTSSMSYVRCLTRGGRIFGSDKLNNIQEVSEMGDTFDVDYTIEDNDGKNIVTKLK